MTPVPHGSDRGPARCQTPKNSGAGVEYWDTGVHIKRGATLRHAGRNGVPALIIVWASIYALAFLTVVSIVIAAVIRRADRWAVR